MDLITLLLLLPFALVGVSSQTQFFVVPRSDVFENIISSSCSPAPLVLLKYVAFALTYLACVLGSCYGSISDKVPCGPPLSVVPETPVKNEGFSV